VDYHESNQLDWQLKELDYNAKQNLVGFYGLLLKIDARNNPHLYQKPKSERYAGHADTDHS